ncbi:hypothetical protein SNEBB_003108 [Seison nebaliae]|nr:hypothetical protein SNEBB_003108 [Seison nebaliae]
MIFNNSKILCRIDVEDDDITCILKLDKYHIIIGTNLGFIFLIRISDIYGKLDRNRVCLLEISTISKQCWRYGRHAITSIVCLEEMINYSLIEKEEEIDSLINHRHHLPFILICDASATCKLYDLNSITQKQKHEEASKEMFNPLQTLQLNMSDQVKFIVQHPFNHQEKTILLYSDQFQNAYRYPIDFFSFLSSSIEPDL